MPRLPEYATKNDLKLFKKEVKAMMKKGKMKEDKMKEKEKAKPKKKGKC